MKCPFITLVVIFTYACCLQAQDTNEEKPKFSHAIYGEFLGPSIFISGNYELGYHYNKNNRSKINFRIGGGSTFSYNGTHIVGSNISLGKRKSFLEIGINRMFEISDHNRKQSLTAFGAGYRFQGYKGFFFHIIPSILFFDKPQPHWDGMISVLPWASLGIGAAF